MNLKTKIEDIRNSVVAIGVLTPPNKVNIIGSGFSVRDKQHILTAAHLFQKLTNKDNIACMVATETRAPLTGYSWLPVEIIDKKEEVDAALLRIKSDQETLLQPLELAESLHVQEGQEVYFLGYPYAANLMKQGFGITLISNRGIISSVKYRAEPPHALDWFLVDAISNPGNSGCPLLDLESNKVIGVMSISFRTKSQVAKYNDLDIREPMHIAGSKPIKVIKEALNL